MITEHSLDRYIERVKGSSNGIGYLERLELYKEITKLIDIGGKPFYYGNFLGVREWTSYIVKTDMVFVVKDSKIVTVWKNKSYLKSELTSINTYKNILEVKKKEKKILDSENTTLGRVIQFILENNLRRGLVKTMAELEEVKVKSTRLKKEIIALNLIIETESMNFLYKDCIKEKWQPLDFYISAKGYKENNILEIKQGLEYLKE